MSALDDTLDSAPPSSSWYARAVEATGKIVGAYSGLHPERQDTRSGEVFVQVDRRPDIRVNDSGDDQFVDLKTHEMYRAKKGDRAKELAAAATRAAVPPAVKSRVIYKAEKK